MKRLFLCVQLVAALLAFAPSETSAAPAAPRRERIAVAEPRAVSGVTEADINGISEYLETKLGGQYDIFSRTALKAILGEFKFVAASGLVVDDSLRQQLAQK